MTVIGVPWAGCLSFRLRVTVTVDPLMVLLVLRWVKPSTRTSNADEPGTEFSSSRSLKTIVSSGPFIAALTKRGPVVSPVPLNTGWSEKSATSPPTPCSGWLAGLA